MILKLKEIINQKNNKIQEIYKQTEYEINKIIDVEKNFKDFDKVKISCTRHGNEIELHKDNKWCRYYLSTICHNGWYVRKSSFGGGFTASELKKIKERLNNLYN